MIGNLAEGQIFVEKTPSHALFIPEIMEILPQSWIIHILRDPCDIVASLLAASRSWGCHWAPDNAQKAAQMWMRHVQAVHEAAKDFHKQRFCEIRYEGLYTVTRRVLQDVCQFLRLTYNEKELSEAIKNNSDVARAGGGTEIRV